jgi:hypothetical protein
MAPCRDGSDGRHKILLDIARFLSQGLGAKRGSDSPWLLSDRQGPNIESTHQG